MPTFTPNYHLAKPLVNNATDQDLWGGELNDDMDIIDTTMKAISDVANAAAPLASPVFTGDPQAPTPTLGDNDTSIATTAFVQAAIPIAATKPEMQAATNTTHFVNPAQMMNHPGVAKAMVRFDGSVSPPTIITGYNIASVQRGATGDYTVFFTTPLDSANYSVTVGASYDAGSNAGWSVFLFTTGSAYQAPTNSSFRVRTANGNAGFSNSKDVCLSVYLA